MDRTTDECGRPFERLTVAGSRGVCEMASTDYCKAQACCYECGHGRKVFASLSDYETTGQKPEDVEENQLRAAQHERLLSRLAVKNATIKHFEDLAKGWATKWFESQDALVCVTKEKEAAADFIRWIDDEFGRNMPESYRRRFAQWTEQTEQSSAEKEMS